jgi:pimeloyl-ACP methyl ester carboxylesterase
VFLQWGQNDTSILVAASVDRLAHARPDAQLRVYPGAEHMLNVEVTAPGMTPEDLAHGFHAFRFADGVRAGLIEFLRTAAG